MEEAKTDRTYCVSELCKNKCWRHQSNYTFYEWENYWFINYCEDYLEKEGD